MVDEKLCYLFENRLSRLKGLDTDGGGRTLLRLFLLIIRDVCDGFDYLNGIYL